MYDESVSDEPQQKSYLDVLRERQAQGRVTTEHQLVGLAIAELLHDEDHKSLYMKLAKEYSANLLLSIAKDIAERENVENPGAYFMKVFYERVNDQKKNENTHD